MLVSFITKILVFAYMHGRTFNESLPPVPDGVCMALLFPQNIYH